MTSRQGDQRLKGSLHSIWAAVHSIITCVFCDGNEMSDSQATIVRPFAEINEMSALERQMSSEDWRIVHQISQELSFIVTSSKWYEAVRCLGSAFAGALGCDRIGVWILKRGFPREFFLFRLENCRQEDVRNSLDETNSRRLRKEELFSEYLVAIPVRSMRIVELHSGNVIHGCEPEHLTFGDHWKAALRIPLADHKGRLLGAVLAGWRDASTAPLDERDLLRTAILSQIAGRSLEQFRIFASITAVRRAMRRADEFKEVLQEVLTYSMDLVQADRGDIGFHDWDRNRFGILQVDGVLAWKPTWKDFPEKTGFIRKVWDAKSGESNCALVIDVKANDARTIYFKCPESDLDIRSELTLRIDVDDNSSQNERPVAIINLESEGVSAFDEYDLQALRILANRISDDYQFIRKKIDINRIVYEMADQSKDLSRIARDVLESVRAVYGFDRGIIFFPDYNHKELRAFAQIGFDRDLDQQPFAFEFCKPSFAGHVFFGRKADWVADPETDPRVCRVGVDEFEIKSPLLGIPLVYDGHPVGVMVLWSENYPPPRKEHTEELTVFAKLASLILRRSQNQEREKQLLRNIERIMRQMHTTLDLNKNLSLILEGVRELGFDRVRVFRYVPGTKRG
jgi:GAF domain-containing protein